MKPKSISLPENVQFISDYGPTLLSMLNGVKHTTDSFAQLYGLDPHYLEAVTKGEQPLTRDLLSAVETHSPLSVRSLIEPHDRAKMPLQDDTTEGVVVCTDRDTQNTVRTFHRGPKDGKKVPYYDYADTAMSKASAFRPEWIKELYVCDGKDPHLADWAFNRGHLECQLTYYVGTVNLHWIDLQGHKRVCRMNTGDVNYGTPFVPHTFTTRKADQGVIIAVTYGGAISTQVYQDQLRAMEFNKFSDSVKEYAANLEAELVTDELGGLIIHRYTEVLAKPFKTYESRELMSGVPYQPHTKAFELTVRRDQSGTSLDLDSASERWGYNVGDAPVFLRWGSQERELAPGASFLIRPKIPHAFRSTSPNPGKVLVIEIQPEAGDPRKEAALIYRYAGDKGLTRLYKDSLRWF